MPLINRWLEYLNRMHVGYSHSIHPRAETAFETAGADRIRAHEFAKTVIYFSERGYGMAVVPADEFVDMVKLAGVLKLSYARLATEDELAVLFPECELGAMPPFDDAGELPVMVDAELASGFIGFTIGTHRDSVRMSFDDYQRLARPTISSIALSKDVLV
jgi:Ala-tRNA(Pro) deacylase